MRTVLIKNNKAMLNRQRAGLGAEVGTGESEWPPKHLGQVLHEGVVRNPDAYKL